MIRYCITVIQYSLVGTLLLALTAAAVLPRDSRKEKRFFALCCAAGSFAALILAILRRTVAINRGMVNTWILSVGLISGLVFLVCLWAGEKNKAFQKTGFYSGAVLTGDLLFYALPSLFLLPSELVLAGQPMFSTEFLVNLSGAALGLLLVILAGLMLFYGGIQMKGVAEKGFMVLFSALLAVNMVNQGANVTQFLMARRIIPLNRGLFGLVMTALNHQNFFIFLETGIALLLPLGLLAGFSSYGKKEKRGKSSLNPAEIRKQKARIRRDRRRNGTAIVLIGCAVFALTALKAWNERAVVLSPAEPFTLAGEEITIPIEQIGDGHLHRFAWNASDTTEVRFIVVKKSASAWGVGLDACDICGNTGYYERRDGIICRLCDVVMNKSTIGFKGGCNPVPLNYMVRDGSMVVRVGDLEREKGRFK